VRAGKDCRKRGEFAKLSGALEEQCDVTELKCVGLCNGPVVVLDPQGAKPAVYSKLRSKRHRELMLAGATCDGRVRRDLSNRRVSKKKVISGVSRQAKRQLVVTSRAA
jgi:hypothetical protein